MSSKKFLNLPGGGKMPILGLGAAIFPSDGNIEAVENAFESALETGYRHFDTAYVYKTEKPLGNVIKRWIEAGKVKREELFITTKLPIYGVHPDRAERFFNESLRNLQLDYVDLYLIHHPMGLKYEEGDENKSLSHVFTLEPEPKTDHIAIWQKLEKLVDAGRAKAIGLSNFSIPQIRKILDNARIKPANLQVLLSAYHQQKKLVDFCHKNGITVVGYSSLGGQSLEEVASVRPSGPPPPNILEDPVVSEIAKKHSKTTAQVLLRFHIQKNIAVIPKSASAERQKQNILVFDFVLSNGDIKRLESLDKQGTPDEKQPFAMLERWTKHPDWPKGI